MTLRLFTGIFVPPHLHERLTGLQGGVPGARWVKPENFHITLSFIGEVDDVAAQDIGSALSAVQSPSFDVTLSGTGSFGSKVPKVLWAGVEPSPGLAALQAKVANLLQRHGFIAETRRYSPHVTLAYLGRGQKTDMKRLSSFLASTGAFLSEPFEVRRFSLIESRLGRDGAHYVPLQEFELS